MLRFFLNEEKGRLVLYEMVPINYGVFVEKLVRYVSSVEEAEEHVERIAKKLRKNYSFTYVNKNK